ncbi:MAG TPA: tetratricopeptide repeat protein [Planctomycetota bacterium]|nr:tetratricopeptide repeat protein [Planctomycetota bacterium]
MLFALGVSLMNTRQLAPAMDAFVAALETEDGERDPKIHLQLGICYYLARRPDMLALARSEFEHTLERKPALPEKIAATYHLALLLDDAGKTADAAAGYRRVLALDGGHVGASHNLGQLSMEKLAFAEAIPFFEQALARQPDFPPSQLNLGICLLRLGKKTEGESMLRKLAGRLPDGDPIKDQANAVLAGKP